MNPDILWWAWLGGFVVLEGYGLMDNREGGTLSELVWKTFKIRDKRPTKLTWLGRVFFIVGGLWLTTHFAFGWFTLSDPWPF